MRSSGKASEPEAEDKPLELTDREKPANLFLTFTGSSDKVRLDVYVSHKRAIVQLDKSISRIKLLLSNFIYYSLCQMKRNVIVRHGYTGPLSSKAPAR